MWKCVLVPIFKVQFHSRKPTNKLVSIALLCVSASIIMQIRQQKHVFPSRKPHRNIEKVVRFHCNCSNGNKNKQHESATRNMLAIMFLQHCHVFSQHFSLRILGISSCEEGSFKVVTGGKENLLGSGVSWLVSFLNGGPGVTSPNDHFLIILC